MKKEPAWGPMAMTLSVDLVGRGFNLVSIGRVIRQTPEETTIPAFEFYLFFCLISYIIIRNGLLGDWPKVNFQSRAEIRANHSSKPLI
jgi:hypothetical protein